MAMVGEDRGFCECLVFPRGVNPDTSPCIRVTDKLDLPIRQKQQPGRIVPLPKQNLPGFQRDRPCAPRRAGLFQSIEKSGQ